MEFYLCFNLHEKTFKFMHFIGLAYNLKIELRYPVYYHTDE